MKGVSEISGLQSIKSMHSGGKRSIPRAQSSAYLDLYMLRKEKDRLEKDIYCLLYTSPSPRDGLLSRMPSSA